MTVLEPFMVATPPFDDRGWQVLAKGDRTGGVVSFGAAQLLPHTAGPGRHVHSREDEALFVISGVLTVEAGDQRYEAGPMTLVWLPRGVPHAFANLSDDIVTGIGVITPGGFERLFDEQAAYVRSLTGPPDPAVFLEISARYGVLPAPGPPVA